MLDGFRKRLFRYLIDQYLGVYVQNISQDQLSFSSFKEGKVENVFLKVEALNEISEQYNLPLEFMYGFMDSVSITVPTWRSLLNENSIIEVHGLNIVVQPKHRFEDVSMFDSMWGSMTTSLQLAEKCLHSKLEDEYEIDVSPASNGVEAVARTIDTVFAKVKVKLVDALIRIENVMESSTNGVALEIKINNLDYFDEAGVEDPFAQTAPSLEKNTYEPLVTIIKRFTINGLSLYTEQFSSTSRKFYNQNFDLSSREKVLIPGSPEMPPTHSALSSLKVIDENFDLNPILISRLIGKQEIRLKLKQNETLPGPKVDVEFNFGALNFYLSPHQVHILSVLLTGLTKPAPDENTLKKRHILATNKPMKEADFALVEQELQRRQENPEIPSRSLQNCRGWSSHSLDESDEEFHPLPTENHISVERFQAPPDLDTSCSSIGSETRSSVSDSHSVSSSRKHSKSKGSNVQALLQDSLSDLTQFRVSCSSICVIILHDDVPETIVRNDHTSRASPLSTASLKTRSETFFEKLFSSNISEYDLRNLNAVRNPLSLLCQTNHLRLMATAITLEGNEKSSSSQRIFQASLSSLNFEILECLFNLLSQDQANLEPHYTEILSLKNNEFKSSENKTIYWEEPLFKVTYQQTDFLSQQRLTKLPTNKLKFHLGPFTSEVDISIVDRIRCLLNPQPIFCKKEKVQDALFSWRDEDGRVTGISQKTEIYLDSPFVSLNIRFPIPDLRPLHDMDRVPWWQQNLRKEILRIELFDASFTTTVDPEQLQKKMEIQCHDFYTSFLESLSSDPVCFLRVSVDPEADSTEFTGFDWPRLVLQTMLPTESSLLESDFLTVNEEIFPESMADALLSQMSKEPSPFVSNPVVYGTKSLSRDESFDSTEEKVDPACEDEIVMPAEKEKIQEFMDKTVNASQYILDFNLPTAQLFFPNKPFFELLYNRLANDLVLWQAASVSPCTNYDPSGFKVHAPGFDFGINIMKEPFSFQTFHTAPSEFNNESDSEDDSMHYSFNEYSQKLKHKHKTLHDNPFTKLTVLLNIKKGTAAMYAPIRDDSMNISQNQCGKLQLNVEDCTFFLASSYKGDPHQAYICLLSNKGTLFHNGCTIYPSTSSFSQSSSIGRVDNLRPIVYRSEPGVALKPGLLIGIGGDSLDVLTIALRVSNDVKQQIKTIKIALGINGSTLRHYMCPDSQSWLTQFKDFLNIDDYPVSGCSAPTVVTEMHFHFENCCVDYRPLHLPLRTFLKAESLSLASNISASTSSLLFRIISEELCIFLSKNTNSPNVDLKKNYVCIIDTGLIDISFKGGAGTGEKGSTKDLCATNNMIHVRTCADSCRALQSLLMYLASDGDLATQSTCLKERKVNKVPVQPPSKGEPMVSEVENRNIHSLMAEAMKDCSSFEEEISEGYSKGIRRPDINFNSADDEFCILDDDPGVGVLPKSGEPQVRVLTNEPIVIHDNHFSVPVGKSDLLKAPKHFPVPLVCYTLHEMTVVWHIYGGKDFPEQKCSQKKKVRINKAEYEDSLVDVRNAVELEVDHSSSKCYAFYNAAPPAKDLDVNDITGTMEHFGLNNNKPPTNKPIPWLVRGGPHRDHSVLMELQMNKVRFRHEVYPEDSEYASRDVLLINDIEIRDRLANSSINKFLYQYACENMPRQSTANMVVVKALHIRPDLKHSTEECSLRVSLKPLRLNIDQDTLMFACQFLGEVCGMNASDEAAGPVTSPKEKISVITGASEGAEPLSNETIPCTMPQQSDQHAPTFFRCFTFSPEVPIRLDYEGKRIDTAQGALQGILMGLGQLNCSVLELKRLSYRHGLLGCGKLVQYVINEWLQDIKKNQLPSLIGGIGPIHAIFQMVQGLIDLIKYPIEAYRKDGQIVRGFRRGASSFSTSTVMALLELTSRLIDTIQSAAEFAYVLISPTPNITCQGQNMQNACRRSSQPADIREGVTTAYNIVKEGLEDTARTLVHIVAEEHEHKGVAGAVGGVLRQIGPGILNPVIHATEAANVMLDGVKNQLKPDAHREACDKWRTSSS